MILNFKKAGIILAAILVAILSINFLIGGLFNGKPADNIKKSAPEQVRSELDIPDLQVKQVKDNFFSEYRMERERVRGRQVEMLQEIINNQPNEKQAREAASLRLVQISEDMEKEMKTENLVKSKGFEECVVIIQPHTTTVIIQAGSLRLDKEKEIKDLVSRVTQCSEEDLCVITREP